MGRGLDAVKIGIGKLNPFQGKQQLSPTGTSSIPTQVPSSNGATINIKRNPNQPLSTSTMTRDELRARRLARVENATNLVEHFHVRVMLRFLDVLCLVTPFWIFLFTTSEIGQLFTHKSFDIYNQTSWNAYAPALIGEAVFAGLTFLWQYAGVYRNTLERHTEDYLTLNRWVMGLAGTWCLFAVISALEQFVYLRSIWQPTDIFGYALIVGRVTLYIGSEWACARYLGWRVTTLHKIAQEEKVKGEIYAELEQQEADRIQKEAEADMHLRHIQIQIQSAERNARIANDVQEIMSQSAVKFLGQFTGAVDAVMNNVLHNVNKRLELPSVNADVKQVDEPNSGEL